MQGDRVCANARSDLRTRSRRHRVDVPAEPDARLPTVGGMATSRVRVRKPASGVGLGILTVAVGLIVPSPLAFGLAFRTESPVPLAGLLVAPFLFALALSAICQRSRTVLVLTTGFVIACAVGATVVVRLIASSRPLALFELVDVATGAIGVGAAIGLLAMAYGALAVGVMALFRFAVWRVVDQDGTLCSRCGYPVAQSDSPTCPECGVVRASNSARERTHRLTNWVSRRRRAWIGGVAALLVAAIAWLVALELPFARFDRTFGESRGWTVAGDEIIRNAPSAGFGVAHRRQRMMTTDTDRAMVTVQVGRSSAIAPMWMRISIPHARQVIVDAAGQRREANLFTDVPPTEIDRVLRDGVPPRVIDGLIARSRTPAGPPITMAIEEFGRLHVPWRTIVEADSPEQP